MTIQESDTGSIRPDPGNAAFDNQAIRPASERDGQDDVLPHFRRAVIRCIHQRAAQAEISEVAGKGVVIVINIHIEVTIFSFMQSSFTENQCFGHDHLQRFTTFFSVVFCVDGETLGTVPQT